MPIQANADGDHGYATTDHRAVATEYGTQADFDTLLREAESRSAELVVVGTHGGGRMREILVGSVARSVATHAKCPVLIVRAPKGRRAPKLVATKSAKPAKS